MRAILDSPAIAGFISDLEARREVGRKGYGWRALVGAWMVRVLDPRKSWANTAKHIREHPTLADALGGTPSEHALYRLSARLLREPQLRDRLKTLLTGALRERHPEYGQHVAIDGSFIKAWANGQRYVRKGGPLRERFSDPDASWGHVGSTSTSSSRGGYGYRVMLAHDPITGLPLTATVQTAKLPEAPAVAPLLDRALALGFTPKTLAADQAYDTEATHACIAHRGVAPVIDPRRNRKGSPYDTFPECEHGLWQPSGADWDRREIRYRCPAWKDAKARCERWSVRLRESFKKPLIPFGTERWRKLYAARSGIEREFGYLKHHHRLNELRVRGLERVKLYVDMVLIARLALALVRAGP